MNKLILRGVALAVIVMFLGLGCNEDADGNVDTFIGRFRYRSTITTFVDSRDGKSYKGVKIDGQVWMTENLNCEAAGGVCYDNDPANCTKYGRLYNWNDAKEACPSGWHLPSDDEWTTLINHAGGYETAGRKLKATSGWYSDRFGKDYDKGGTDDFCFAALPGGSSIFGDIGIEGRWWSATERAYTALHLHMNYGMANVGRYEADNRSTLTLFSVRCVQDE